MLKKTLFITLILIAGLSISFAQGTKTIIELSWDEVIEKTLDDNLNIRSSMLNYEAQQYETWKSLTGFIPSLNYQGLYTKNLELPVFIFMGQRFVVGTNYSFQHSLNLNLPLFTGGARWFNYNIQKNLKKSLAEELKGKEEETVLDALKAYYGVILAKSMYESANEAVSVAKSNLEQVEKFYNAGTATELDLQRAKAQYYSTLPQMESASSNKHFSAQRLKLILNIPLEDSLAVKDSLSTKYFLKDFEQTSLDDFISYSKENRTDLKSLEYKFEATEEGEKIALSQFAPTVIMSASVQHQAQLDNSKVTWGDYIRAKSLMISVNIPLFQGGSRILDWQIAKIRTEQMKIAMQQMNDVSTLDVEQNYYGFNEAQKNLKSLQEAFNQSKESLRLSNLLYSEGMSTQLDVLNAQLLYNSSQTQYLQGVYSYNVAQLALLKSIGLLNKIWK